MEPERRAPAVVVGKPLLEVRGLSKAFKGVQALDKVTLQVRQGEILGLLGPNGSGKSTFINVVSGHYPLSAGEVVFDGRPLSGAPAHRIAQAGIARTYQIPRPFKHLTVLQNVGMTRIDPVMYQGVEVIPLQFLKAVLPDPGELGQTTKGKTCIGNALGRCSHSKLREAIEFARFFTIHECFGVKTFYFASETGFEFRCIKQRDKITTVHAVPKVVPIFSHGIPQRC